MTELDEFSRQVERFKHLLEDEIKGIEPDVRKGSIEVAIEELLSLSEELATADEQLRHQNEELIATQNELNLERQRFQDLFQYAPNGYVVTDLKGVVQEANQTAAEMLAINPTLIAGKPLLLFVYHEDRKNFLDGLGHLNGGLAPKQKSYNDWQIRLGRKRHGILYISLDAACVAESPEADTGRGETIRWIMRDVSHQKLLEAELSTARRKLIFGREQERQQLAREIHDSPVQDLIGALILISNLVNQNQIEDDLASLEELRQVVTRAVRSLRTIIGQLRPPAITPFGLEKAIRSHILDLKSNYPQINFHLDLDHDKQTLPEEVRLNLFRIYQTSITNLVRHSQATNAYVRFELKDGKAYLEVADDGVGFKVPERFTSLVMEGHLGLANAAERAEVIGGHLKVKSQPGKGAAVQVVVPVSAEKSVP